MDGMEIVFDEATNVISIWENGEETVRIKLPEGADPEEVLQGLLNKTGGILEMSGDDAVTTVRDDLDAVDDALIDMIDNESKESNQVAADTIRSATKNIALLTSSVCENPEEEKFVEEQILNPLARIAYSLYLPTKTDGPQRDELIQVAASWLPIRAAVEYILDELES